MSLSMIIAVWTASMWLAVLPPTIAGGTVAQQRRVRAHPGVATVDVSGNGRFIAFESQSGLVSADTNDLNDVYVLDRSTGRVTLESVAHDGGAADGTSLHPRLSADGRFVVFESTAGNLVKQPVPRAHARVLLRDRATGVTRRVSETREGEPANQASGAPDISDDGRIVVFHSSATNLVQDQVVNGTKRNVYLLDVAAHSLTRISVDGSGRPSPAGESFDPSTSGDGSVVAFTSTAPLESAPAPPARRACRPLPSCAAVFVRDVRAGTTLLISRTLKGRRPNDASFSPAVSADGQRVAFASKATDLGPRDRNHAADVYLYDRRSGTTTLVSTRTRGRAATGPSAYPAISADGRYVAFTSDASDLRCAHHCASGCRDHNLVSDVYVADTESGAAVRISRELGSGEEWWEASAGVALDSTARIAAFSSLHPSGDADLAHDFDAFVRPLPPAAACMEVFKDSGPGRQTVEP